MLRSTTIDEATAPPSRRRNARCTALETTELNFVHFDSKVSTEMQARLHAIDGVLCSEYLPYDSYLVLSRCTDPAPATAMARLLGVSWVGPAQAEHKLDPALHTEPPTAGLVVTVLQPEDADLTRWAAELRGAGIESEFEALAPLPSTVAHSCARQVLHSHGLCSYGLYRYGQYRDDALLRAAAYIVMTYIVMTCSCARQVLHSYGLHSYGLYSHDALLRAAGPTWLWPI